MHRRIPPYERGGSRNSACIINHSYKEMRPAYHCMVHTDRQLLLREMRSIGGTHGRLEAATDARSGISIVTPQAFALALRKHQDQCVWP